MPFSQQSGIRVATLLVDGEVEQVRGAVVEILGRLAPEGEWTPLEPYSSYWDEWFAPFRLQLLLVGALAAFGIRKAVGAPDGSLIAGVVRRGMATALIGALIGLAAWYAAVPFIRRSWWASRPSVRRYL